MYNRNKITRAETESKEKCKRNREENNKTIDRITLGLVENSNRRSV